MHTLAALRRLDPPSRRRSRLPHVSPGLVATLVVAGTAVAVGGCSGPSAARTTDAAMPPAENALEPGQAPTPFSIAEIREGCSGRELSQEIIAGGSTKLRVTKFGPGTLDQADIEMQEFDPSGKQLGERNRFSPRWVDLQKHAGFPADRTRITSESYTTPAGKFDCWRYEVIDRSSAGTVERFWFAKKLPGPPVRMEVEQNGRRTITMTLIGRR